MSKEIEVRPKTVLELAGVPKAKKPEPNAVFERVHHLDARQLSERAEGESGSSGKMRATRPEMPFGCVWCKRCNKPCDFEEGGLHNLFGKPDSTGHHRGYILIRAECHGEKSDILMTFQQARENSHKSIIAFDDIAIQDLKPAGRSMRAPNPDKIIAIAYRSENPPANEFDARTQEIMDRFRDRQAKKE